MRWQPGVPSGENRSMQHLQRQLTVMNARVAKLVAGGPDRMPLAGDQLYVDLDISVANLPAGSLLAVGEAVLAVSDAPHLGCAKFVEGFGADACALSTRESAGNCGCAG